MCVCVQGLSIPFAFFGQYSQDSLEEMLPPDEEEEVVGEAVVLDTFKLTGHRKASVAGCRVKRGTLERNCRFRILRNKEPLFEGESQGIPQIVVQVLPNICVSWCV